MTEKLLRETFTGPMYLHYKAMFIAGYYMFVAVVQQVCTGENPERQVRVGISILEVKSL
ncbi:MAG: hypothetical protein Q9M19_02600 [Mariprofundaceae bacterium]|nr:hypothetical protein [Mariprofundaceae bacterium]